MLFGKTRGSDRQPESRCACGCEPGKTARGSETGCGSGTDCQIQVLGAGCASCRELYENTRAAAAALGITGEVAYITDLKRIAGYGIMSVPALVVNGRVLSAGKTLKMEEVKLLLSRAGI